MELDLKMIGFGDSTQLGLFFYLLSMILSAYQTLFFLLQKNFLHDWKHGSRQLQTTQLPSVWLKKQYHNSDKLQLDTANKSFGSAWITHLVWQQMASKMEQYVGLSTNQEPIPFLAREVV